MQLLQDVFIIENLQVINEGSAKGPMKIKGIFGRCNEKNNNGRIYPTTVLEGQLKKVQPLISERRLCGELDHPQNDTVKLSNASHLITKLDMKGDELIGEAEVLQTPAGLTAQALVNGGVKIGISSRGMGTLSEDQNGDKIVNEDFRLVTFDLVADPSTRGAYPGLSESTESQFVRETQSKLEKEGNFVTMLESKMRDAYTPWIEEAKSKTKSKKKLTARQSSTMDTDKDGDIDSKDLKNLRGEAMEYVRQDGHWHRIGALLADALGHQVSEGAKAGYPEMGIAGGTPEAKKEAKKRKKKVVAEGYADELERIKKEREVANPQPGAGGGVGAPGFADRWRMKRGEIAKARGQAMGQRIKDRGAAGGDVGLRAKLGLGGAGSANYARETDKLASDRVAALRKDIESRTKPKPEAKPADAPAKVDPKPAAAKPKPAAAEPKEDPRAAAKRRRAEHEDRRGVRLVPGTKSTGAEYISPKLKAAGYTKDPKTGKLVKQEEAYKRLGKMLAEMLHLSERTAPMHTQSRDQQAQTSREFAVAQSRLPRHKQMQAGMSKKQKADDTRSVRAAQVASDKKL
jgi:hypothetical protein